MDRNPSLFDELHNPFSNSWVHIVWRAMGWKQQRAPMFWFLYLMHGFLDACCCVLPFIKIIYCFFFFLLCFSVPHLEPNCWV
jgi:hypothetical protein